MVSLYPRFIFASNQVLNSSKNLNLIYIVIIFGFLLWFTSRGILAGYWKNILPPNIESIIVELFYAPIIIISIYYHIKYKTIISNMRL